MTPHEWHMVQSLVDYMYIHTPVIELFTKYPQDTSLPMNEAMNNIYDAIENEVASWDPIDVERHYKDLTGEHTDAL